ncbi:tryptophan synthase subunit alpha [Pseudohongiella acticola]|uniref:Tryptophan synthase alpha chain n=1 Tax=Pseudohongiella acticola TaxID=1524254 RepID=A0A1E8CGA3_9GAMM|nr:tryptophan synthase subunit alpha [Pseudohongiella acticola]OFE11463.1 tryptophan synthase subunit alpha [Pseudohongiella acticola]
MSRIKSCIAAAQAAGRKALIPYIVAGDPDTGTTVSLMHQLVQDGADIIELGMPFSDPSSDGAVIQLGAERALRNGAGLDTVFSIMKQFRQQDDRTPVVLMGYLNPIETLGYDSFVAQSADAGVDGLLLVDLPVSEAESLLALTRPREIDVIFLVAPTTTDKRIAAICDQSSGYLYYVSLKGVTGAAISDTGEIEQRVSALRSRTDLPIMVGFGIKDNASAIAMASISDGVIVGSALVQKIGELSESDAGKAGGDAGMLADKTALIASIRKALDEKFV